MTPTDTPLTVDVMLNFFNYVATTKTATYYFIQADLYGGANSVVNSVSLATNSFGHRDKFLGFQLYTASSTSNPPFPAEGLSFVDGLYSALVDGMGSSWIAGGVPTYGNYVNYGTSFALLYFLEIFFIDVDVYHSGSYAQRLSMAARLLVNTVP